MKPLITLLASAALTLAAQDAALGARVHGLMPMGDLRDLTDGQLGAGVAVYVAIPVGNGLVLRPLVGTQFIPKGGTLSLAGTKTSVTSVDLMVDALWFPGLDLDRGPYLIGSVGGQQWRLSATGTSSSTLSYTRIGASAGLGYQASPRLGFEARGFWSPIAPTITATGLMIGATVRF
ncbi:MAG TPA: hypothetical protein VGK03_07930 [Geothrix sp.]|jgi:hypothetical protein